MCIECPEGYTGHRCDVCSDGYYGDPIGRFGPTRTCVQCDCNKNIDPNAIGNCNTTTGECLKCIHNTGGPRCDQCLPGLYVCLSYLNNLDWYSRYRLLEPTSVLMNRRTNFVTINETLEP